MKKSTMALSAIAVLVAVTTGGAWYTGNQIEQRYPALLEQLNGSLKSLNLYGVNAEISEVKLAKGVFSSDVQYNVNIKAANLVFPPLMSISKPILPIMKFWLRPRM